LATSGDLDLAISGDFYMATDKPPPAGRPRRTYLHLLHSTASSEFYIDPPSTFMAHDLRKRRWS
jgi:hypothetical protein